MFASLSCQTTFLVVTMILYYLWHRKSFPTGKSSPPPVKSDPWKETALTTVFRNDLGWARKNTTYLYAPWEPSLKFGSGSNLIDYYIQFGLSVDLICKVYHRYILGLFYYLLLMIIGKVLSGILNEQLKLPGSISYLTSHPLNPFIAMVCNGSEYCYCPVDGY